MTAIDIEKTDDNEKADSDDWPKSPEVLVESYGGLVQTIVRKLWNRIDAPVPLEDLEAYAFKGLLEAGERYDPTKGVRFTTFAYQRVRGAVLDGVQRQRWKQCGLGCRLEDTNDLQDAGRGDDPEATAGAKVRQPGGLSKRARAMSMLLVEPRSLENVRPPESPEMAEEEMMRRQEIDRVMKALKRLSEMEQEIVMRHCVGGESMRVIAEDLGCSKSWVCKLKDRATEQLREYVEALELEGNGELAEVEALQPAEEYEKAA